MSKSNRWILIVGYGSIGRRHYQNLMKLGWDDVRLVRSGRTVPSGFETPADTTAYATLDRALADLPWVTIVANPSSMHAQTAKKALQSGSSVLIEKPIDSDLSKALSLLQLDSSTSGACAMAYCFRYHPLYRELKSIVESGRLGRIFHASLWQAQYLPQWHPWEDYRTSYAARRELGGGVVKTLDHELDMVCWLLGMPESVHASVASVSGIEVDVEDTADMIFRYSDRAQAHVHVSFGRRDYERGAWVAGEHGTAILDWNGRNVRLVCGKEVMRDFKLADDYDINDMYSEMLEDVLSGFSQSPPVARITLQSGVNTLRLATQSLLSSSSETFVKIGDSADEPNK